MERSGTIPAGGIRPPDLVELVERAGPFASVCLGLTGQGAYGEPADAVRIESVGRELKVAGTPAEVSVAVEDAVRAVAPGTPGVVAIADPTGVALLERLPEPPRRDIVTWSSLPSIAAVLEHRQADIPMIVVLADRLGADIVVSAPEGPDVLVDVEGNDHPLTKSAPGGWSQRRYQQRVENTWERNASNVTRLIMRFVAQTNPVLLVLGGDVRAVELTLEDLPDDLESIVRNVTGGRAPNGSEERRERDVERLVHTAVAEETVNLLRAFEQEVGRSDKAVNGAEATIRALQQSRVDVLLVHDEPDDDRVAWFSERPGIVDTSREALIEMGATDPRPARLVDVAINGALRTGAGVRIVPDAATLDSGIGALLRWSDGEKP